ncbi:MAG: HPr family phosphocarrier protein [Spirochaetes bacterium]|nr:HPr family phosphocarrier protein [Spirochaetota bacterium]
MKNEKVTVGWRAGLHGRPASLIVNMANKFKSKISIKKGDMEVDAKSILGIMMLGAIYKTELIIIAEGDDEHNAVLSIVEIFENELKE